MQKKLGIIGGMGPLATAVLFQRIIELTEASCDQEHIRIFIDNNTNIPDRTLHLTKKEKDPFLEILASAYILQNAGADLLIIPCNTAHFCYQKLQKEVRIPIISIIKSTVNEIINNPPLQDGLGLLGTKGLKAWNGYLDDFKNNNIACYELNELEQEEVSFLINNIKKEGVSSKNILLFTNLITNLQKKGWKHFILACTELALMESKVQLDNIFINTIDLLAKEAILACGYKVRGK